MHSFKQLLLVLAWWALYLPCISMAQTTEPNLSIEEMDTEQLLQQAESFLQGDGPEVQAEAEEAMSEEVKPGVEEDTGFVLVEEDAVEDTGALINNDVVLVLDNSGSMKKNDPQFLANEAVREFIGRLDETTRLAIIIFDQNVKLAVPFTEVTIQTRAELLSSLGQVTYKGLYTDSPAAVERAIYELKDTGREDARKSIVFMTDGIVDTGDANVDLEKARWLKNDLAADAADSEIKIFGVAFTEAADFQLIQSLAQQTDGEYYRALQAEDLARVFEKINNILNKPPEPESLPEPVTVPGPLPESSETIREPESAPEPVVMAPPQPVIIEVPVQQTDEDEKIRSMILIAAVSVMIIALIAILLILIRRSRSGDGVMEPVQEAYLNDIHGYTDLPSYKLGGKPTMLGRVAGKETEHLNYIVIPQTTIGRRHALIEYKDFAFWVIDQGSINGTFVNDKLIEGETRLKHGDRLRLHKYEFEFSVPELAEDGKTVMSNTVLAGAEALTPVSDEVADEPTVARRGSSEPTETPDIKLEEPDFDLDFDITSGVEGGSEDVTAIKTTDQDSAEDLDEDDSSDETIMLDDDSSESFEEEDATIRRALENKDTAQHFVETAEIDLKDLGKKEKK